MNIKEFLKKMEKVLYIVRCGEYSCVVVSDFLGEVAREIAKFIDLQEDEGIDFTRGDIIVGLINTDDANKVDKKD